jgi:hypothetical protein
MLFVAVRRSLGRISVDEGLLAEVASRLEMAARGLEEEKKATIDLRMGAKALRVMPSGFFPVFSS